MSSKGRRQFGVRGWVALALTLAVALPLGWMWWQSRLPGSYSAMEMGYLDYGGKLPPSGHEMAPMAHDMDEGEGGGHASGGPQVSVTDLDTEADRPADKVFDLTVREQSLALPGSESGTARYTINGRSPGPTLEVTEGELIEVRLHNASVGGGVALHWHGVDVPNAEDGVAGVTQDAVHQGESFTYRWVAPHVGTYWYHSHQLSHEQVEGGLLGTIVVHPRKRASQEAEVVGVAHTYTDAMTLNGRAGAQHVEAAPGDRVRVRLVNTDNGPQSAWVDHPYRLLAVDGYDVHEPAEVQGKTVGMPAGGRVDIEVEVPSQGAVRVNLLGGVGFVVGPTGSTAERTEKPVAELDLLHYGTPTDVGFDTEHPDRTFEYSIGRRPAFLDGRPGLWWSVNGHTYPDMPMFVVEEGDVAVIEISNHSGQVHPMHLHGHHAVVLSRDGKPVTGSPWWFDSLDVPNGSTFTVAFLADNPGLWMDHCHNLKHATEGLVTHLMYEGVTTPFRIGKDTGNEPE